MEFIGTLITYLMMACCVAGGISYIVNDQSELGRALTVRRTGTGSAETEQTALLGG